MDNLDPKALERIKVRVMGVHDMENTNKENAMWAQHCAPSKSCSGEVPDKDDYVYVMFLGNNPMSPIWLGWVRSIEG